MAAPQICNFQPHFHDSCPDRAKFCEKCGHVKPIKKEEITKPKASCGHYLRQSEADFCYYDKQINKSQPKSGCSCKHHGPLHKQKLAHQRRIRSGPGPYDNIQLKGEKDTKDLKRKLEDCIKDFDKGSPEMVHKLEILRNFLNTKIMGEQCFPKPEWPQCPVQEGPDPYEVPHPYLPKMIMWAKPQTIVTEPQVTLDGRLAEQYRPKTFYYEEPPLNVPPWILPRYKSQELRGGKLISGCKCWMKNGLQDDCPRWDCGGRPECKEKPLPACPPSMNCPVCGVRKSNLYHGKPPTCAKQRPPPPYPEHNLYSIARTSTPKAPSIPCPLHEDIS